MVSEKEDACWMEACKKVMITGGWKIRKEVSVTKCHPDPVKYVMWEKEKIPGGWNSWREANNTQWDWLCWEDKQNEKDMIPGGWNSQKDTSAPNMILGQFKALQEKEMIPDRWNSKREASNNQHGLGAIDKNDSWWMEQSEEGKQYPTWSWPYSKWSWDDSWWMAYPQGGKQYQT